MKSSANLHPSEKAQRWIPTDFVQKLLDPDLQPPAAETSEPAPLFEDLAAQPVSTGAYINRENARDIDAWLPTEFNLPRSEKQSQSWTPAMRYNTAATAAEVATQILNDARRQAEEMVRLAETEANSIREQAYQDGMTSAVGEMHQNIETTRVMIEETARWRDELMEQSEPIVLDIIRTIAQKLFGEGFVLDQPALQETFNRILENARSLGNLRIYVNPEDALLLGPYWRELQESITTHKVEIIPSQSISRGGCYVNGQWGSADGRIETQLRAIMETLVPEKEQNVSGEPE